MSGVYYKRSFGRLIQMLILEEYWSYFLLTVLVSSLLFVWIRTASDTDLLVLFLTVYWAKVRFMMFQGQMNLAVIYLDRVSLS